MLPSIRRVTVRERPSSIQQHGWRRGILPIQRVQIKWSPLSFLKKPHGRPLLPKRVACNVTSGCRERRKPQGSGGGGGGTVSTEGTMEETKVPPSASDHIKGAQWRQAPRAPQARKKSRKGALLAEETCTAAALA